MTYPGFIFWILLIWAANSKGPRLLYLFFAMIPFGSLAVVPPELLGGTSFLPAPVCALTLIIKTVLRSHARRAILRAALQLKDLGLLTAFFGVSVSATTLWLYLFTGIVTVIPFRTDDPSFPPAPLRPSVANITQMGYLTISVFFVFVIFYLVKYRGYLPFILNGLFILCSVLIITGLIDLGTATLGISRLLDPFRNAAYSYLVDNDVLGSKRIVGLFTEASAYGPLCVSAGATIFFVRFFYEKSGSHRLKLFVAITTIVMGALSLSSTAILELAIFGVLVALDWIRRLMQTSAPGRESLPIEATIYLFLVAGLLLIFVVSPDAFQPIFDILHQLIFAKSSTSSFVQRNQWTSVTWNAMFASDGLGVGVGSSRSSNWFAAIFGCTGFLGGFIWIAYLLQNFLRKVRSDQKIGAVLSAMKISLIIPIIGGILVGPTVDFGTFFAVLLGIICSCSTLKRSTNLEHGQPSSMYSDSLTGVQRAS